MTTAALTRPVADLAPTASPQLSFGGVVRSELVKLRSVRSSTWTLLGAAAGLFAFGLINSGITGGLWADPGGDAAASAAAAPLAGSTFAQLVIAVLGVLVMTSEYATGMIRSTLTAVPSRLPVLWAKTAVVVVVTLPVMIVTAFGTFWIGEALISAGGVAHASIGDPGVLRAVLGTAANLTGVAVLGVALGTILRSTASALSVLFGAIFLLPGLGGLLLPASWRDDVLQYLPSNAGSAFSSVVPEPGLLSSGAGVVVFAAWVLVPLAAAAVLLRRRSA